MEDRKMKFDKLKIRPMEQTEYSLLEDFLYEAIYQPEGNALLPRDIIRQPELAVYKNNFGAKDDICLLAELEGLAVGAVWTRILAGEPKGYGNVDEHTPEFAISVKKEYRGCGIGTRLMREMISLLSNRGYVRVSLSVDKANSAYRLYRRLGFQVVKEQEQDYLMVRDLP